MPASTAAVVQPSSVYERLTQLAEEASTSVYQLAIDADVSHNTIYAINSRIRKGRAQGWSRDTLHALSTQLARKLGRKPSEVYGYLTGLDDAGRE